MTKLDNSKQDPPTQGLFQNKGNWPSADNSSSLFN